MVELGLRVRSTLTTFARNDIKLMTDKQEITDK